MVDGFAAAVGDGERAAGFSDGVGGAAIEELRFSGASVGAVEAELEGGGAAVDGEEDLPSRRMRLRRVLRGSLPLIAHVGNIAHPILPESGIRPPERDS